MPRIGRSSFATGVYRDKLDYYKILDVQSGATEEAIRKAYAALTAGLKPEMEKSRFKELNEAFVILTDNKTRDAYDSLLSVRKSNYMSPEETQSVTHPSYLANRKLSKLISIYQDRKN